MEHCCNQMESMLAEPRILLIYEPHIRGYHLPRRDCSALQRLFYCPWCGKQLPRYLKEDWFDIFFNELKLAVPNTASELEAPGLPEEFKTDEWWKKRGL